MPMRKPQPALKSDNRKEKEILGRLRAGLSDEEIQQRARELNEEVFNLRFQLSTGMAKNPSRLGQARRDLARAQTVLRERKG